jgi:hypothetical protein
MIFTNAVEVPGLLPPNWIGKAAGLASPEGDRRPSIRSMRGQEQVLRNLMIETLHRWVGSTLGPIYELRASIRVTGIQRRPDEDVLTAVSDY